MRRYFMPKESPKTVRDMNGLITAVMKRYCPETRLKIALPKKLRTNIYVPTKNEVKHLRNDSILKEIYRHALPEVPKI